MSNKKIPSHYLKIKKEYPDFIQDIENLGETCKNSGPLDTKTAHLIQLAAAVATKSEGAAHSHTRQLLQAGASPQEIKHALILLTSTIGFPTVMAGLSWVNDIVEAKD